MENIALKSVDGVIYSGEVVSDTQEFIKMKNIQYHNVSSGLYVPNLKQQGIYYDGEVIFSKKNIIWVSRQEK